jgi:hypothetical protein
MMASDDEKIKTNSALENEAPPEKKSTSGAEPRLTAENQLPPHPPGIVGVKARNPFLKLIGITGT